MGQSYTNEIYFSMSNGKILSSPRNTWDIAFRTMLRSSSIITNDGSGVILYTYPKSDTSGWAGIYTSGFKTWTPMYNDPNDWENGAFSRDAKGYPDYGWAVYNPVSHDLNGDSLVYFIRPSSKDVYQLYFTGFAGGSTGDISFNKGKVLSYGINEPASSGLSMKVYPNPVRDKLNLLVTASNSDEFYIVLSDLSGRQLGADHPVRHSEGLNQFSVDVSGFDPGLYFVTASTANMKAFTKVIITR